MTRAVAYQFSNVLCKNIVYIEPLDPSIVCRFIWTYLTIFLILSRHQRSHHYLQSFLLRIVIRAVCYSIACALCKKNCLYWASVDLFRYGPRRPQPYPGCTATRAAAERQGMTPSKNYDHDCSCCDDPNPMHIYPMLSMG